ncbi:hypothetical protein ABZ352_23765 [Streptomyces griseofuscus]|uniref:hypothetical protein n=1 Tax=Streptomyces griseofuscus TaxID=146922 RepID=UPI00340E255C
MGLFTRRSTSAADKAAEKAYKRGDQVYVRTINALPGKADGGLALAITRIEAAGWRLENQHEAVRSDHGYRQRYWTLTFRAAPNVP